MAGVTREGNHLILITLNVNLNSHIRLETTLLDSVVLNFALPSYNTGRIMGPSLPGLL